MYSKKMFSVLPTSGVGRVLMVVKVICSETGQGVRKNERRKVVGVETKLHKKSFV